MRDEALEVIPDHGDQVLEEVPQREDPETDEHRPNVPGDTVGRIGVKLAVVLG
jgi:hypothetical protein